MSLIDHAYEMIVLSNFHEIGGRTVFLTSFIISFAYLRHTVHEQDVEKKPEEKSGYHLGFAADY